MRIIFFLLICFSVESAYSQIVEEDLSSRIQLRVYNHTEQWLTLIVKSQIPVDGLPFSYIARLAPLDTTTCKFELNLPENHVPQSDFKLTIFEAPDYYNVNEHYYWNCERIEGEYYTCLHLFEEWFNPVDTLVFDSTLYFKNEMMNLPIYEEYELDSADKIRNSMLSVVSDLNVLVKSQKPAETVELYVRYVVELDGSVSNIEFLRTSHEEYNGTILNYFSDKKLTVGYKKGFKTRYRYTIPIRVVVP